MKNILSTFVKYPFYAKVIIVITVLLGTISFLSIKKSSFPLTESHTISISVSYQGATPKEMDEGITSLIEEAIRGVVGLKEFSSTSQENSASVNVTVLNDYDVNKVLIDVKNAVDGISNFPASAEKPTVSISKSMTLAMFISLRSKDDNLFLLKNEAQNIEDDFLASGLISQLTVYGYPSRMEVSIEVTDEMLRRHNISISDISAAVSANNLDIYAGEIRHKRERLKINSRYRSIDPVDIENIVVKAGANGELIKIKDLANVVYQFQDTPSDSYTNGEKSVTIRVDKLITEDLEDISEYIRDYIDTYNSEHENTQLLVARDFYDTLKAQLSILYGNGLMGVFLVIIALSIFLSFRLSLWVAWGIPSSFLAMIVVANLCGVTVNMISVFGMILIIGILVDDGIVVGENIFTHFEMGKSPRRASIDGTLEVMPAVITSVSTTIIAFMPLFFIEGMLEMMYELGFVVVVCLLFSLFEGLLVLPSHLASKSVLKPVSNDNIYGRIRIFFDKAIFGFRDKFYIPLLHRILRNKIITLSLASVLFIFTAGLINGGFLPVTFFPKTSQDNFTIDLSLKPGVSEEKTKEILLEVEKLTWEASRLLGEEHGEEPPIETVMLNLGSSFSRAESGTNSGMLRVFTRGLERSAISSHDIKVKITELVGEIPDAYKFAVGASSRFGAPVSISLMGRDSELINKATVDLEAELKKFTSLYNIMDNSQLGGQEIRVKLKPVAYSYGLTQQSLLNQVRGSFYGSLAQRIQNGKDEVWFYVRYPNSSKETVGDLEKMLVTTPKGDVPFNTVAEYVIDRGLTKINHYNGRTEVTVSAYMLNADEPIPPILAKIESEILPPILDKYKGISYMYQGQKKDTSEQMDSIVLYFGIAFLIIILIIMIYFRSFLQGFMVIAMIPFGVIAALWGHGIEGEPLSIMSLWGIVALSGTIINDAVVFMSRYNQNLVRNLTVDQSVIEAAKSRFRPILLTTITTTLGLFPLVKEASSDAAIIIPMAISLAYGILLGTMFILTVLPVYIIVINKAKLAFVKLMGNKDATPESIEVAVVDHKIDLVLKEAMEKEIDDNRSESDLEL